MRTRWKIAAAACMAVATAAYIYPAISTGVKVRVRPPAVAGRFYPSDAAKLKSRVREFLGPAADSTAESRRVIALVAPHAGYDFSGATAGKVYARLRGRTIKRVVVMGPSHGRAAAEGWVDDAAAYAIPGGQIPVDREAVQALGEAGLPAVGGAAPAEHSIEVQLPLLVAALEPGWKLVPILIATDGPAACARIAAAVRSVLDDQTVVCVSSDFTHYGHAYGYVPFTGGSEELREKIAELDGKAIDLILARDAAGFLEYCGRTGATICGRGPTAVLLHLLGEGAAGEKVAYTTSAEVTGDYRLSVSYAGIVFSVEAAGENVWGKRAMEDKTMSRPEGLTEKEKSTLIAIARSSLESAVRDEAGPDVSDFDVTDALRQKRGAFVTLNSAGRLRGCIGYVEPIKPLWQAVMENAANAALRDPRFKPVREEELADIHVEISAMSPLERISDPALIEVGKHGIMISRGLRRGLLLPQVATEYGWNREEFLVHTCRKAGLPVEAWRDEGTTIEVFWAEVFGEEKHSAGPGE